ncbi:MAG: TIR domain-containing protein [Clostridia bacterium]|nr:TIR domain-containing protein [Clostridia bacterium]
MKRKIEKPKVFISYAWGSKEYQDGVLAFATSLMQDGIDVVLDKWDLTEGNDTYAFMEQSVTDPSITNVLILLDPLYAQKADKRSGGVGTETQIISPQVYKKVDQDKFLPIIMKRDSSGNVCKPAYLQGALHFDLTSPDTYDDEYIRLVKKLYGEEVYKKPPLGSRPKWVDESITVPSKTLVSYQTLTSQQPMSAKRVALENYLEEIKNECVDFAENNTQLEEPDRGYIVVYDSADSIREKYLQLLKKATSVEDGYKKIAVFFEGTKNALEKLSSPGKGIMLVRLHEFFLYTIAIFLKVKDYQAVGYLFGKTYFYESHLKQDKGSTSFQLFNAREHLFDLDQAMNAKDGKIYHTGTGHHWIESIAIDYCSKEQFVLADLLCYNYSVYSSSYSDYPWFPLTYIYDDQPESVLWEFTRKMISKEYAQEVMVVFGFQKIEDFAMQLKKYEEEVPRARSENVRYPNRFDSAPILSNFIKSKELGTLQ